MKRSLAAGLSLVLALSGCATLKVTPEIKPAAPSKPVPAKLGVHFSGEQLKKAFASADRARVGTAPGQFFSDVILLPPDTRYNAPQDILDQFGTDLILQVQVSDTKAAAAINPIFFAAMPLTFFLVFAPMVTNEVTVSLEANVRDGHSGRLLWARTEQTKATGRAQGVNPGAAVPALTERTVRNALAHLFEAIGSELKDYRPGSVAEARPPARPAPAAHALPQGAGDGVLRGTAPKPEAPPPPEPVKAPLPPPAPAPPPKPALPPRPALTKYAIVIGIENYRERLPKAEFAAEDAREFYQFLTKQGGYREENVVLRLNEQATKSDLEKYFEPWLRNNVDSKSSLLVYFSGHGTPQMTTGEAYLVPYDGDPAYIEQTGYPLKRLYQSLESLPAQEIVVMLDSCFSGGGGRSVLPQGARPLILKGKDLYSAANKTVVLSATSGNHISLSFQEKGHGLFTYYALQGLGGEADSNGDGAIDVQELFDYLKPQVRRVALRQYNTEQVPQLLLPPRLLDRLPPRLVDSAAQ